jgi:hypothetical protein
VAFNFVACDRDQELPLPPSVPAGGSSVICVISVIQQ